MTNKSQIRDWLLLLTCNIIWSCYFVLIKLVQHQVGTVFSTLFPLALSMIFLIPIVNRQRRNRTALVKRRGIVRQDIFAFIAIGVFGQVATQLFGAWGTRLTLASNGALIGLTAPIATAIMAHFLLRERMSKLRWASFFLALAGIVECSGIRWGTVNLTSRSFVLGNTLLFISVLGSAFYNVYSKRLLQDYLPLEVILYSYYAAAAVMLPIGLYLEPNFFANLLSLSWGTWLGLILLAVFHYFLSMVILLNVLTRIDATLAGLSNYLIPFFGLIVAAIVLHERLTVFMFLGGLLVLSSTLIATVSDRRWKAVQS